MNAQDAATAAAIMSADGWNPNATASDAIIGNIIEAVAVFDVSSVKKITSAATTKKTTNMFRPCKPVNCEPIHSDRPDSTKPAAIASPPPKRSKIPHGNLSAVLQSSK